MMQEKGGIFKAKLKLNYFFCYNETAQDPNISAQAKGVLMYLLSLPEGWKIYVTELHNHFTNGRDGIIKAFNELVEHEYIVKTEVRDGGKFKENLYQVYPVKFPVAQKMGILATEEAAEKAAPEKEEIPHKQIIDYLNERTGKSYKHNTANTLKSINGRWADGFRLKDFVHVIDVKTEEWKGTEYEQYLNPTTLFRPSHFEKYANQPMKRQKSSGPQFAAPKQTGQAMTEEERQALLADILN